MGDGYVSGRKLASSQLDVDELHVRAEGTLGATIYQFDRVRSTNDVLRALIEKGARPGSAVVAEEQTLGRGRRHRGWLSPHGTGLLCSVYIQGVQPHLVNMISALAVRAAVASAIGMEPELKWPNDILLCGRKFSGVLAGSWSAGVVAGIGVNVNTTREQLMEIDPSSTSLQVELGKSVDRTHLLDELLDHLDAGYHMGATAPAEIVDAWRKSLMTLGKPVEVRDAEGTWEGEALDVAKDGALLVTRNKQLKRLYAADVSVRPL